MATSTALSVAAVHARLEGMEPGATCGTSHMHRTCPLATYLSERSEGRESYVDLFFYWSVAHPVHAPAIAPLGQARTRRCQRLLQLLVEHARPGRAAMHGAEHLHVAPGIQPEAARHAVGHDVDDQVGHALGVVLGEEVEVVQTLHDRHLAGVDAVRVGDHTTLLRLAAESIGRLLIVDTTKAPVDERRLAAAQRSSTDWYGDGWSPQQAEPVLGGGYPKHDGASEGLTGHDAPA